MKKQALISEYFILGITQEGVKFRPSDWAERLCGVVPLFSAKKNGIQNNTPLRYSLYARPVLVGDLKCIAVDKQLKTISPAAFDFIFNFAKENKLEITEACVIPDEEENK